MLNTGSPQLKNYFFRGCVIIFLFLVSCKTVRKISVGQQSNQKIKRVITVVIEGQYLLYLPQDYDKSDKKWPLILFLHGAGERGSDLNLVKVHGPPKLIEQGEDFPFIIVSPQCPKEQWWSLEFLDVLLKEIVANYHVDESRIYVTGLSMGGFGSWALAVKYPNRFAAIAPICGGGNPVKVKPITHLPVWVFHGAKDKTVPLEQSQVMVDALKRLGGNVKFTIYPDAAHDSWTETYNNPELYHWFLQHHR